jgi:pectin methylesterase-like acyl-CoA thioesterase
MGTFNHYLLRNLYYKKYINQQRFIINLGRVIILSAFIVFYSAAAAASDWYVDGAVASSGDGTSWATAFKTITEGINGASAGDAIHVAVGTYQERLVVNKQLSITGTGWDSTIVQPVDIPSRSL